MQLLRTQILIFELEGLEFLVTVDLTESQLLERLIINTVSIMRLFSAVLGFANFLKTTSCSKGIYMCFISN